MADKTTTIKVVVDSRNADRALEVLRGNFKATADVIVDTGKKADQALKDIEKSVKSVDSSLGFLQNAFKAAFVIDVVESFGRQLYDINTRFQGFIATMSVVTGSVQDSKREFEFITTIANKYGVRIESLTATYAKLAAAGKDSALTHSDLHKIFEAMSMASNVLHLSMEETRLVFYALQQMVSKGNVTMEELRRQLAEKFPGAVNMMSQALEVSVKELEKLIKTGQVAADQALPKFADIVMQSFGPASQYAVKTLNAEVARLHNSWFTLIQRMAESSGLIPAIIKLVEWMTKSLNDNSSGAVAMGDQLAKMVDIATKWVQTLTAEDVKTFFTSLVKVMSSLVPVMQLLGAISAALLNTLGPIIKNLVEFTSTIMRGDFLPSLSRFAAIMMSLMAPGLPKMAGDMGMVGEASANAAAQGNKVVGVIGRVDASAIAYGKTLKAQLADAQTEYALSERSASVKLKERDATKELADMTAYRATLLKAANNAELPIADRIQYYKLLVGQEKDYIAVKKEANQEMAKAATAYKQLLQPALNYVDSLTKEANQLSLSREELQKLTLETLTMGLAEKDRVRVIKLITDAQLKYNQAKDNEALKKAEKDSLKDMERELENLDKMIETQTRNNEVLGKSAQATREYDIAQLELALSYAELNVASNENYDISQKEHELMIKRVDKLRELVSLKKSGNDIASALEVNKTDLKENLTLWKDLDQYTDKFFLELIVKGKTAFQSLREDLKKFAAELASLALKKFLFYIVGNMIGGNAGGQMMNIASTAGANTLAGAALNGAGSMVGSGISGITAGMGLGTTADFAVGWGAAGQGLALGSLEGATAMTKFGFALKGALPILSYFAIALAGAAVAAHQYESGWRLSDENNTSTSIGGIFSGGESGIPGATWMASAMDRTFRGLGFNDKWSAIMSGSSLAQRIFGRRQRTNDAFGISGNLEDDAGFTGNNWQDWSEQGGWFSSTRRGTDTASLTSDQTRFLNSMISNVTRMYGTLAGSLGVDSPLLGSRSFNMQFSENGEDISQKVLAKYFADILQEQTAKVFDLSGNTNLATFIRDLKGATDEIVLMITSITDLFVALDTSTFSMPTILSDFSKNSMGKFDGQSSALLNMARNTDLTAQSIQQLTSSTIQYREAAAQMIIGIENIKMSMMDMFAGTRENIVLAGLDKQGQYNYYQTEADKLYQQLGTAGSAEEVDRITRQINDYINKAFGMLTPEQQASMQKDWLDRLDKVNVEAQAKLTEFQNTVRDRTVQTLTDIKGIMEGAADKFNASSLVSSDAASIQLEAANIQLSAANTPITIAGGPSIVLDGG